MLIGWHLKANKARAIQVDYYAQYRRYYGIAGQRILPFFESWMAYLRVDKVHFAVAALVLLVRCDLSGVRRPKDDWPIAVRPAGVVRGVAEVLNTVSGQLRFFSTGNVSHPQIVIANEDSVFSIRR